MRGEPGEVVLGRYRIEHQIGRGGFGRIYLARQVALARAVALKVSSPEQRRDLGVLERFRREAVLVASISHPNVVTYHDFGMDDDGDMILVMEYLQGRSLFEVIRAGECWPATKVVAVVRQAADGLFAAHQAGIVHRDVKPSNLFLTALPGATPRSEGRSSHPPAGAGFLLKVIDFGILRVDAGVRPDLPDLTAPEAVIGTPAYLAPEMLMGFRPDPRADQYALALVACELLTGRRAFGGPEDPSSFLARVSRFPPELDLVPPGPRSVLRRALSTDPGERFETIVDFAVALEAEVVRTTAVSDSPTRPLESAPPIIPARRATTAGSVRRGLRKITWIGSVGVAMVSAAIWWWTDRNPTSVLSKSEGRQMIATVRDMAPPHLSDRGSPDPLPIEPETGPDSRRTVTPHSGERRDSVRTAQPPMTSSPTNPGFITINARPWANVWLNGERLGRTPILRHVVSPGLHSIRFEHPSLGERTVTRVVRAGDVITVSEDLQETAARPQDFPLDARTP